MKTQAEHGQRWEDIIFENRNKAYGAYAIRKNNNADVLKAEAIAIGIAALIFIIPILLPDDPIVKVLPVIPDDGLVFKKYDNIKPDNPPTRTEVRPANADVIPIKATIDEIIEKPIDTKPTESVSFTEGQETGDPDPGPAVAASTGTGTETVVTAPKIHTWVEVMPEFEGGYKEMMKFLQRNIRYPRPAERRGAEGTVYVSFVIGPDGSVINVLVEKGFDRDCDAEAVRVISKMNKWKAGIQNNMPVFVKMVLPIKFQLEK